MRVPKGLDFVHPGAEAVLLLLILMTVPLAELKAGGGTGTLFGSNREYSDFFSLDLITGERTAIGSGNGFSALAVDPTTGIMYGGDADELYTINPATGASSFVGDTGAGVGFASIHALDFRADGTLFASIDIVGGGGTGGEHLAIINKTTGAATPVGPFGVCTGVDFSTGAGTCDLEGIEAIAFDLPGNLWAARRARGSIGSPGLYSVNSLTGAATFLRPIVDSQGVPASGGVVSLQFGCDGTLFGGTASAQGSADDEGKLITINPATGVFSFVGTAGSSSGSLASLAFENPCTLTTTPPVISSICGPSNPAGISGSTGAQGVLDPANTDASKGIVWPAGAAVAGIALDTGHVQFADANGAELPSSTVLPGVSGYPAFADGKLHFTGVRLPAGKSVIVFGAEQEAPPELVLSPVFILSCQDVVLEGNGDGTLVNNGVLLAGEGFLGGGQGIAQPAANAAGFGPRLGARPAAGSIFPPEPGGGGDGGSGPSEGGSGGVAAVIAAAGRIANHGVITVNPRIFASLVGETIMDAESGAGGAHGGAGGSLRLAAVLVEGVGKIDTSAGMDSDGVVRSAAGPVEIQAFLQDLFTGTASTTPIRGNPVAAPLPENLPEIGIVGMSVGQQDFCSFECSNTGSLESPDITLSAASAPVDVMVEVFTRGVPLGTPLTFRAVGTDGSAVTAMASVQACDCSEGEGFAADGLTLNPGVTYQIVVYPDTAFALARGNGGALAKSSAKPFELRLAAGMGTQQSAQSGAAKAAGTSAVAEDRAALEKWGRMFGVDLEARQRVAQVRAVTSDK